ncbi:hypothetical protein HAV15_012827 [Penicillium sp. str. |nr:hypothetical protein HAV15_012827 [Penicillium sp. str. \
MCVRTLLGPLIGKEKRSFPFLIFDIENDPIRIATDIHLSGARKGGSEATNPYSNPTSAFYITFFEQLLVLSSDELLETSLRRNLKIGRLYDKPREDSDKDNNRNSAKLAFRQSSFTTYLQRPAILISVE